MQVSMLRQLQRAVTDLCGHGNLPGYRQLGALERQQLNVQALLQFVCSGECFRLLTYLGIWLLAAHIIVWRNDLQGTAAVLLPVSALGWVMPWVAGARRRFLARLLGRHWPDF